MPVPKRKHSKRRVRIKRNEKMKKTVVHTVVCSSCKAQKLPHRICEECGN